MHAGMPEPCIGSAFRVSSSLYGYRMYVGAIGRLVEINDGLMPYKLRFADGSCGLFREGEIEPLTEEACAGLAIFDDASECVEIHEKQDWAKCKFKDGSIYTGGWQSKMRHGDGRMEAVSGDTYVGQWMRDRMHGQGKYTFEDGSVFEGSYQNGSMHGRGVLSLATGGLFDGEFVSGFRQGFGRFVAEAEVYEGEWSTDKAHGSGTGTFASGDVYTGQWADGAFHGKGCYEFADGTRLEGVWSVGVLQAAASRDGGLALSQTV